MPIIWSHFDDPVDESTKNFRVKCKHCDTTLSTARSVTSNLHKHLKVMVVEVLPEFDCIAATCT